jgi:hypothetical protein
VFPAVGGNASALHPLTAWWAVLYGLSMMARYEPAAWIEALNVNGSSLAVPIEALLDDAQRIVPELILCVFAELSA